MCVWCDIIMINYCLNLIWHIKWRRRRRILSLSVSLSLFTSSDSHSEGFLSFREALHTLITFYVIRNLALYLCVPMWTPCKWTVNGKQLNSRTVQLHQLYNITGLNHPKPFGVVINGRWEQWEGIKCNLICFDCYWPDQECNFDGDKDLLASPNLKQIISWAPHRICMANYSHD